jgi:xylan 1,4-beta-xylosidase
MPWEKKEEDMFGTHSSLIGTTFVAFIFTVVGLVFTVVGLAIAAPQHQSRAARVIEERQPQADLGNSFFRNPILPGKYPDPSVVRVGSDYYMTHSSMHAVPGLFVWHSRDLVNWRPLGYALNRYVGDVWAPDIVYHQKTFFIYFPARVEDPDGSLRRTNFVVTAADPAGPWTDPMDLRVGNIDPGHLIDGEGGRWLFLSDGHAVPLSPDGTAATGEVKKVYDGWTYPEEWDVECKCLESPKLFRRDGFIYMISAQGGTAGPPTSHMVIAARSRSPLGPWENSPTNPILHTESAAERWWSQGHATLIDDTEGNWWMMYHGYDAGFRTLGRETLLLPIEWTEDGWPVVPAGTTSSAEFRMPPGENIGHGLPLTDEFEDGSTGLQWRSWNRGGFGDFYRVKEGRLLIEAAGESPADAPYLGCFPVNHGYEAETAVTIPDGGEAGLLLLYDEKNYAGISLSAGGIFLYWLWGKMRLASWEGNSIHLKIRNAAHGAAFYYSADGKNWTKSGTSVDLSGFHHNVLGGFRSLKIALYAAGDGTAAFEYFRYRGLDHDSGRSNLIE